MLKLLLKYRKYTLPMSLLILTAIVFTYNPVPRSVNPGIPHEAPIIKLVSVDYQSLKDEIRGEKTYLEIETSLIKNMKLVRDPFERSGFKSARRPVGGSAGKNLRLQGIWDSKKQKIAFINGKMVKVNDTILGYKVLKISSQSVKLSKYGQLYSLKLGE
ncbi:hypothetical protein ACFL4D_00820 [Candidatus Margulisiibacteriota bacterium]